MYLQGNKKLSLIFVTLTCIFDVTQGLKISHYNNLVSRPKRDLEECGIRVIEKAAPLIIGGDQAEEYEYPWVVAVYDAKNDYICAGSIITLSHVLSAAHCFTNQFGEPKDTKSYTIIAGKYYRDMKIPEEPSQVNKIKRVIIYDDYRGNSHKYRDDIAIAELAGQLTITLEVRPICIDWTSKYEETDFRDGNEGILAAWGFTSEVGTSATVLNKVNIPYRQSNICWENFSQQFRLTYFTTDKFCAGYLNKSKSICNGDSGAGLYFKSDGKKYFVRGIASIGVRSSSGCDSNHYALYTRVSRYLSWLKDKLGTAIDLQIRLSGDGRCTLPVHPKNGAFKLNTASSYAENAPVNSSTTIFLSCENKNYQVANYSNFYCLNSKWLPPIENAHCNRICEDGTVSEDCSNLYQVPADYFRGG